MQAETMKQTIGGGNGLQAFRSGAQAAMGLGAIGLILAVIGIYGIVSFSAAQRTREIGIRMALGGSSGDVMRLILRQGVRMVIIGLGIGLLIALGVTRAMTRLLIGVSPERSAHLHHRRGFAVGDRTAGLLDSRAPRHTRRPRHRAAI